jgi:hypothetical protein
MWDARRDARRRAIDALREEIAGGKARNAAREALWRREVVERTVAFVESTIPEGARVLVVSRGDEEVLGFEGRRGEHFPQGDGGVYAGHHPADSSDAIARLEALRAAGAQYLVIPATSGWWLEHYGAFAEHLTAGYPVVASEPDAFVVYGLEAVAAEAAA